jgi:hypothetical protein
MGALEVVAGGFVDAGSIACFFTATIYGQQSVDPPQEG